MLAEQSNERVQGLKVEIFERAQKKRILVVDDHALVRAGFRELIDATVDLVVEGEAGTAASALELATKKDFDVVMLDISLPDASVVETVTLLQRRRPDLPILIVSMHAEKQPTCWRRFAPFYRVASTSAGRLPKRWRSRFPETLRSHLIGTSPIGSFRFSCSSRVAKREPR